MKNGAGYRSGGFYRTVLTVAGLVAFALLCRSVARRIEIPELSRLLNFIRTSVYVGLFSVWGVSAKRRVVQPQVRRYLVAVSALMVGWMILREIKYRFTVDPDVERFLWYLYYIPILVTPLVALIVSVLLGRNESYRLPRRHLLLYLPTAALITAFVTNDLHQLAFRFPDGAVWSEHVNYRYGVVFYLAVAWGVFCSVCAMVIMLSKSRSPRRRGMSLLPLLPIVTVLAYVVVYALKLPIVSELGDIAAFESLVFTGFFEICIQLGLIPSNTRYYDLFRASSGLSMQITDDSYNVKYSASAAEPFDREELIRAEAAPVKTRDGRLLHNMPIRGGHAVWTEDISELLRKTEELRETQAELNDRSEIVQMEYEEERERGRVEEQTRLLDMLQSATQTQLDKVKALTERYPRAGGDEKRRIVAKIVVLGSFIKRRKDLLLSSVNGDGPDESRLSSAFDESFRSLRAYGISGGYAVVTGGRRLSGATTERAYDFFEDVLECVIDSAKSLNVSVAPAGDAMRCSVSVDCETENTLSEKYPEMRVERDGGTQFILPLEGGEAV